MRYHPDLYARAFLETLEKAPPEKKQELYNRFIKVIAKNGDLSRVNAILRCIERALVKKNGGRFVKLEFARSIPENLVAGLRKNFSEKDKTEIAFNPSLVAGVRITIDEEKELNNSLSSKLKKIFN